MTLTLLQDVQRKIWSPFLWLRHNERTPLLAKPGKQLHRTPGKGATVCILSSWVFNHLKMGRLRPSADLWDAAFRKIACNHLDGLQAISAYQSWLVAGFQRCLLGQFPPSTSLRPLIYVPFPSDCFHLRALVPLCPAQALITGHNFPAL